MTRTTLLRLALSAGMLFPLVPLSACGSSNMKAQRYDDMTSRRDREYEIRPEGEVLSACGLDSSRSYFTYDSSVLSDDDRALLGDVGHCLTAGRLAGRAVLVTGYTDDQGTAGYNLELGLERARTVAMELASRGVYQQHIYVRSSGERRATGDTTSERALDRKVELRVLAR